MPTDASHHSLAALGILNYLSHELERKYRSCEDDVNTDVGRKDGRDVASLMAMLPCGRPVLVKVILGNRSDDDGLYRFHMGYDDFDCSLSATTSFYP